MTITTAAFALGPASSWDPETRQFNAVIVSGPDTVLTSSSGVRLQVRAEGLDATGIEGGTVPLLHEHDRDIQLGRVLSLSVDDGRASVRCCLDDPGTYNPPGGPESDGSYISRIGRDALHALETRLARGTQTGFSMRVVDMVLDNPRVPGEARPSDTPLKVLSGRITEVSATTMPGDPGATALTAPADGGAKLSAPTEPTMTGAAGSTTAAPTAPTAPTAPAPTKPPSSTAGVGFAAPMTDDQLEMLADKLDARQQRRQERFRAEVEEAASEYDLTDTQRAELLSSGLHGKAMFKRARDMDRANRSDSLDAPVAARMSSSNRRSSEQQHQEMKEAALSIVSDRVAGKLPDREAAKMFHPWQRVPTLMDLAQGLAMSAGASLGKDSGIEEMAFSALVRDDIPELMRELVNKQLREDKPDTPPIYPRLSVVRPVRDFSTIATSASSGMTLTDREEGGPTRISQVREEGSTYKLGVADTTRTLSYQVLVGDDIGWVQEFVASAAPAVRSSLERKFHQSFMSNPNWGGTTTPVFHASRSNLVSGVLNNRNLDAAVAMMEEQVNLTGDPGLYTARFLLVPSVLKGTAKRLLNDRQGTSGPQIVINDTEVSTEAGNIEPISSPWLSNSQLDGNSKSNWYLFASPTSARSIQHAVHEQQPGPYFASRTELNRDVTFYLANSGAFAVANPRGMVRGEG